MQSNQRSPRWAGERSLYWIFAIIIIIFNTNIIIINVINLLVTKIIINIYLWSSSPISHHWILTQGLPQNLGLESIFPNLISGTTCNWVMPYPSIALIPTDSKQKSLQMISSSFHSTICIFQLLKFKKKCHILGYFVILWDMIIQNS